ncbi:MAG: hypothetical protein WEA56_00265 [Balneolaceae bacterium]
MENKTLLLAGGSVGVFAAFSLAFLFGDLWIGFFAALLISVIYLFLLDRWMVRPLASQKTRKTVRVLIILLAGFQIWVSVLHFQRSGRQSEILSDIRTTIDGSISQLETERPLHTVLRHYHLQPDEEDKTVEVLFRELMDNRLLDDGTFLPSIGDINNEISFTWLAASPDSVIITSIASITKGEDPEFINANEQAGFYQANAILTPRGVRYEREN